MEPEPERLQPPALVAPEPIAPVAPRRPPTAFRLPARRRAGSTSRSVISSATSPRSIRTATSSKRASMRSSRSVTNEVRQSAGVANRMLERPMSAINKGVFDSGSPVSKALRRSAQYGRVARSEPPWRSALAAQAARHHSVRQQAARLFRRLPLRAIAPQRDHRDALPLARTSCNATTPRSSKRRPTCGR